MCMHANNLPTLLWVQDFCPIDSRDCPWVPELDALDPSASLFRGRAPDLSATADVSSEDHGSATLLPGMCNTDKPETSTSIDSNMEDDLPGPSCAGLSNASSLAQAESASCDVVAELKILEESDGSGKAAEQKVDLTSDQGQQPDPLSSTAGGSSTTGALLRQSLLSAAFGVRAAVKRLRARYVGTRVDELGPEWVVGGFAT
jgi:hypothetical protein